MYDFESIYFASLSPNGDRILYANERMGLG
jgi:hypothetical protein